MAVPNPPVDGTVISAAPMNANYTYLEALAASKLSSPVSNANLQNDNSEFVITRYLSASELVSAVSTQFAVGAIPFDAADGDQQYQLISVSVQSMLAGNRTTAMVFSVQGGTPSNAGGAASWTNLVTGITVSPTLLAPIVSTPVGAAISTNSAANGFAGLRLLVTQQGVNFASPDSAVVTLKFSRTNGLRSV